MRQYRKVIHTDTYGGKRLRSIKLRTPRLVLISRSNAMDEWDRRRILFFYYKRPLQYQYCQWRRAETLPPMYGRQWNILKRVKCVVRDVQSTSNAGKNSNCARQYLLSGLVESSDSDIMIVQNSSGHRMLLTQINCSSDGQFWRLQPNQRNEQLVDHEAFSVLTGKSNLMTDCLELTRPVSPAPIVFEPLTVHVFIMLARGLNSGVFDACTWSERTHVQQIMRWRHAATSCAVVQPITDKIGNLAALKSFFNLEDFIVWDSCTR